MARAAADIVRFAPRRAACLLGVVGALAAASGARAATGAYTSCPAVAGATIIDVSGPGCPEAQALAAALAAAPAADAAGVLSTAGWTPLRALSTRDRLAYDLVATRGLDAVRFRFAGAAPGLDGWAAGRELIFARQTLRPNVPLRSAALCTSSFLIRLAGRLAGLTAGHCGGLLANGTTDRRNVALRRRPQTGTVLGRVERNLERTTELDALVAPVPTGPLVPASDVVDRGTSRPPWFVAGAAAPYPGSRVCFSGRTSGPDQCGQIVAGAAAIRLERLVGSVEHKVVRCATMPARSGDSGAPVYTAPAPDGTVRAVGIATLALTGPLFRLLHLRMCFTPLAPVLAALGAELVPAG
jgi:hypothetical protein